MAVSFLAILGIVIGLQIVVAVVLALFFILRKNKKSKKKTPKASPSASPDASTPEPDPILIANDDGTYALVDSVESFSRNRPRYGRRPRRDFLRRPGHGKKPDRDPVYGTPGFEEDSDVEIMPITRPNPGRDPVYGISIDREKPGYGIGRPMRPRWGRRERFEEQIDGPYLYTHKTENYLEVLAKSTTDGPESTCGSDLNHCRLVKFKNREDVFWYLSKVYRDIKTIHLDRFNELMTQTGLSSATLEIVNKDPLTLKVSGPGMEGTNTIVLGEDIPLGLAYSGMLETAKLNGRPLPRPVESEDYSINLNE